MRVNHTNFLVILLILSWLSLIDLNRLKRCILKCCLDWKCTTLAKNKFVSFKRLSNLGIESQVVNAANADGSQNIYQIGKRSPTSK